MSEWLRRPTLGRPRSVCFRFFETKTNEGSGPISRVLSRTAIYLGPQSPAASSAQPGRTAGRPCGVPICVCSRWGLPSCAVADALVRFYHTVSAFPSSETPRWASERSSLAYGACRPLARLSRPSAPPNAPQSTSSQGTIGAGSLLFCGTFHRVAPSSR